MAVFSLGRCTRTQNSFFPMKSNSSLITCFHTFLSSEFMLLRSWLDLFELKLIVCAKLILVYLFVLRNFNIASKAYVFNFLGFASRNWTIIIVSWWLWSFLFVLLLWIFVINIWVSFLRPYSLFQLDCFYLWILYFHRFITHSKFSNLVWFTFFT